MTALLDTGEMKQGGGGGGGGLITIQSHWAQQAE